MTGGKQQGASRGGCTITAPCLFAARRLDGHCPVAAGGSVVAGCSVVVAGCSVVVAGGVVVVAGASVVVAGGSVVAAGASVVVAGGSVVVAGAFVVVAGCSVVAGGVVVTVATFGENNPPAHAAIAKMTITTTAMAMFLVFVESAEFVLAMIISLKTAILLDD